MQRLGNVTEDEEAELLSFTGKTIDGKLYVDFEDFNRLRLFVSNYLESFRQAVEVLNKQEKEREEARKQRLDKDYLEFLDRDIQGGQV